MDTCLDKKEKIGTFKIWKTLIPGKKRVITANISEHAECILCNAGVQVLLRELNLVKISIVELGFGGGAKFFEAYNAALESGLKLFPNNAIIDFRDQYCDQRVGEKIALAIEPIKNRDGVPSLLLFGHNRLKDKQDPEFWIKGFPIDLQGDNGPSVELVFALND